MCGIILAVACKNIVSVLLEGLRKFGYRGTTLPILPYLMELGKGAVWISLETSRNQSLWSNCES